MHRGIKGTFAALALAGVAAFPVAAQEPPGEPPEPPPSSTPDSTVPPDSSSTTVPPDGSTTSTIPGSGTSSTTRPPVGELPVDPALDESSEEFQAGDVGSRELYADQPAFDPLAANGVWQPQVAAARNRLRRAERALADAEAAHAAALARVGELEGSLGGLDATRAEAVKATAAAHTEFKERVVDAYVRGGEEDLTLWVTADGSSDLLFGQVLLETALAGEREGVAAYLELRAALDAELEAAAAELIDARRAVDGARSGIDYAGFERLAAVNEVEMWEAGAHAFITGYTFPVAGAVRFGDSFGAPRMTGTSYEHWHEGTDIFAAHGTPLVATEDGVIAGVRTNGVLGGNSLKIVGVSGYTHYYAHLSGFAPGIADGYPVRAGELVGYVGDTGNARGTSPHLHYEIALPDRSPINPFPILAVAHRWREQLAPGGVVPLAPGGG